MKRISKQNVAAVIGIVAGVAWLMGVAYIFLHFDSLVLQNAEVARFLRVAEDIIRDNPIKAVGVVATYCTMVGAVTTYAIIKIYELSEEKR